MRRIRRGERTKRSDLDVLKLLLPPSKLRLDASCLKLLFALALRFLFEYMASPIGPIMKLYALERHANLGSDLGLLGCKRRSLGGRLLGELELLARHLLAHLLHATVGLQLQTYEFKLFIDAKRRETSGEPELGRSW